MAYGSSAVGETYAPVGIENETGAGGFVFLCEHASNYIPPSMGTLGLDSEALSSHIAWDPGALGVARALAGLLDSPLVASGLSRLLIDCNRETDAPDLIPVRSELTDIPGNADLDEAARRHRINLAHVPFHAAAEAVISARCAAGLRPAVVSLHSFTPVYKGVSRPWEIGLIHDRDPALAAPVLKALADTTTHVVGDNEPYSPADGVFYSLDRHAQSLGLPHLMIEIRNDLLKTPAQEQGWARLLAPLLKDALAGLDRSGGTHA
ncbi:N-formylglutamate amidohydrolase [Roseibium aestuarii]|uniref:N-formylglutamate amidohydrolase n=1 Tax=Roseibium aestuarii TaxID=2600299 RepID=A0ABW4JTF8_9HYPH|nr:N-formylglutamate amidohydrolase [Roseibium aestuarii]